MNTAFWDGFEKQSAVDRKHLRVIQGGKSDPKPKSTLPVNPKIITDKERVAAKAAATKATAEAAKLRNTPMSKGKKALIVGGGLAAYGGLLYGLHHAQKRRDRKRGN